MSLACEDLAPFGVVLVPPSTRDYHGLKGDIERRLKARPEGSPPINKDALLLSNLDHSRSAILINGSGMPIASIAYIWWFRRDNGRIVPHRFSPGTNPSPLLPFGLPEATRKFNAFWNTIFSGSKRLFLADGGMVGDNTDVRAPLEDELRHGGFFSMSGGSAREHLDPVGLTLDGVFFTDGGFAGPNRLGAWEQTLYAAEAHLACAALAREARIKGVSPSKFFIQLEQFTGQSHPMRPPPPLGPAAFDLGTPNAGWIRKIEMQMVGYDSSQMRARLGEDAAMRVIDAWGDATAPRLHKLQKQ